MHVVQRHGFRRVLDQVGHVIHGVDQTMDLLAVNRGDEGLVQGLVDLVRDAIGRTLGTIDLFVKFLPQFQIVVIADQI